LEGSASYDGHKSGDTLDDPPSLLSIGSIPSTSSLESSSECTVPRQQDFLEGLTKNWWVIHPDLKPFIRPCISGMDHGVDSDGAGFLQTDFSVCFLGTGAGIPSVLRKTSATALRLKGMAYLFDAGEGVQSQIMLSGMSMSEICKIFITHLHGDHVFGLPGLLLAIQLAAVARDEPTTVQVYGPVGLYNFIAANLSLSCAELHALQIEVYELRGGSRRKWVHPGTIQNYSEFKNRNLFRKSIPQNKDGTWTLQTAMEITSPEEAEQMSSTNNDRGFYVHAAQVSHVPALQCFGYVVQEPLSMPQRVDAERAKAAGVKPGRKYKVLKAGFSVTSDDGLRRVHPNDVIVDGEHIISRKFALLGDCCGVPAPMAELCRDADVLVHEATLLQTGEFFYMWMCVLPR
jgi:ribonuclease Z